MIISVTVYGRGQFIGCNGVESSVVSVDGGRGSGSVCVLIRNSDIIKCECWLACRDYRRVENGFVDIDCVKCLYGFRTGSCNGIVSGGIILPISCGGEICAGLEP